MNAKTEKILAYCLAALLLLVGVASYAASGHRKPENPVRIMFKNAAGGVLFTHKIHYDEDQYGISCTDCHHDWDEEPGTKPERCGYCHEPEGEDFLSLTDAYHTQCQGCHEDLGSGPIECSECHVFF